MVFMAHDDSERSVLVGVRLAIWESLNDPFLPISKSQFVEISFEDARGLVNDEPTWRQFRAEIQECCFSGRRLGNA